MGGEHIQGADTRVKGRLTSPAGRGRMAQHFIVLLKTVSNIKLTNCLFLELSMNIFGVD